MVTRERIIKAAIIIFAEMGYHKTRMENIARYGKFNKAMIYQFYHGKEELYIETVKVVYKDILENINLPEPTWMNGEKEYVNILKLYMYNLIMFFRKKRDYVNIMLDAITSKNFKVFEGVKNINGVYKSKNEISLINFLEVGKSYGFVYNMNVEILMMNIFSIIIIALFPDAMYQNLFIEYQDDGNLSIVLDDKFVVENLIINGIQGRVKKII